MAGGAEDSAAAALLSPPTGGHRSRLSVSKLFSPSSRRKSQRPRSSILHLPPPEVRELSEAAETVLSATADDEVVARLHALQFASPLATAGPAGPIGLTGSAARTGLAGSAGVHLASAPLSAVVDDDEAGFCSPVRFAMDDSKVHASGAPGTTPFRRLRLRPPAVAHTPSVSSSSSALSSSSFSSSSSSSSSTSGLHAGAGALVPTIRLIDPEEEARRERARLRTRRVVWAAAGVGALLVAGTWYVFRTPAEEGSLKSSVRAALGDWWHSFLAWLASVSGSRNYVVEGVSEATGIVELATTTASDAKLERA